MELVPATRMLAEHELFSTEEEMALVGFLASYSGLTREAYQLDLRQYARRKQTNAGTDHARSREGGVVGVHPEWLRAVDEPVAGAPVTSGARHARPERELRADVGHRRVAAKSGARRRP